ncbi:hydrolase [Legionella birminghamensis]|uniref:3-deoxy-D-manno-octulosonate 8-phosphate phosphatase KdsC n=1 Tax=Legionella birminghamensis TaxID=28083 RepID=A0A378I9N6_9GAMM|nr:HAD-IIIA family hydrolase [Legionella birminghamensis]KTC74692.1 hydrolase [Legionella birminghamensis]STX31495.1 hydrolase [Legionella birminghamensis]
MDVINSKASKIKCLVCDVDGVFTNTSIFLDSEGEQMIAFSSIDCLAVEMLQSAGIKVAILSTSKAPAIVNKMSEYGVICYTRLDKKLPAYLKLIEEFDLQEEEIAYIGDDLPDLPIFKRAGLSIAVANAMPELKEHADWSTARKGGNGAVREVSELLLRAQNKYQYILQYYME